MSFPNIIKFARKVYRASSGRASVRLDDEPDNGSNTADSLQTKNVQNDEEIGKMANYIDIDRSMHLDVQQDGSTGGMGDGSSGRNHGGSPSSCFPVPCNWRQPCRGIGSPLDRPQDEHLHLLIEIFAIWEIEAGGRAGQFPAERRSPRPSSLKSLETGFDDRIHLSLPHPGIAPGDLCVEWELPEPQFRRSISRYWALRDRSP